jgi:hypothetical protein
MRLAIAIVFISAAIAHASILPAHSPAEAVRLAELAHISYLPAGDLDAVLASRALAREVVVNSAAKEGPRDSAIARSTFAFAARATADSGGIPKGSLVIAIRGSLTLNDWYTNAHLRLREWSAGSVPGQGRIHEGFLAVARVVLDTAEIVQAVRRSKRVYLVGHSLGGAAAVIVAAHLLEMGIPPEAIRVFTFGAPRLGDRAFAKHYATRLDFYEYRNSLDPFFVMPSKRRFRHLVDERPERFIWLTRGGGSIHDVVTNPTDHHPWCYVFRMHGNDTDVISVRFAIPLAEITLPFVLPQIARERLGRLMRQVITSPTPHPDGAASPPPPPAASR